MNFLFISTIISEIKRSRSQLVWRRVTLPSQRQRSSDQMCCCSTTRPRWGPLSAGIFGRSDGSDGSDVILCTWYDFFFPKFRGVPAVIFRSFMDVRCINHPAGGSPHWWKPMVGHHRACGRCVVIGGKGSTHPWCFLGCRPGWGFTWPYLVDGSRWLVLLKNQSWNGWPWRGLVFLNKSWKYYQSSWGDRAN